MMKRVKGDLLPVFVFSAFSWYFDIYRPLLLSNSILPIARFLDQGGWNLAFFHPLILTILVYSSTTVKVSFFQYTKPKNVE